MMIGPAGYFVFPDFDHVAFHIGPLAIKWYGIAYFAGIMMAWWYCLQLIEMPPKQLSRQQVSGLVNWITIGIVLGGRLGDILLWRPAYYLHHPLKTVMIWEGGMAFHGGLIGAILAMLIYARRHRISFFTVTDVVACAAPLGLFLGRLANFINGELWGRITTVPWAVIFPLAGAEPRHPSQLYEAALEGLLLFFVMYLASRSTRTWQRTGTLSGIFLIGYGILRGICECFREPEINLGAHAITTWGQVLCVPMILFGLYLLMRRQQQI